MKNSLELPKDHSIQTELRERLEEVVPKSMDIPAFLDQEQQLLPQRFSIGNFDDARTYELCLWEFYRLLHKGYPYSSLVSQFKLFADSASIGETHEYGPNLSRLVAEMARIILRDWNIVCAQWAEKHWHDAFRKELEKGNIVAKTILSESGRALAFANDKDKVSLLEDLFRQGLKLISMTQDTDDPDLSLRFNWTLGCLMFCTYYRYYTNSYTYTSSVDTQSQFPDALISDIQSIIARTDINPKSWHFLQQINHTIQTINAPADSFMPHLLNILNNTVRPARHFHPNLLPIELEKLENNVPMGKIEKGRLKDELRSFIHSVSEVTRRSPYLLDTDSEIAISTLRHYAEEALKYMEGDWPDDLPPADLSWPISMLNNFFPCQQANAFYKWLAKLNISLRGIIDWTQTGCQASDINFELRDLTGYSESTFLLAPNEEKLKRIIENYTFSKGKTIDRTFCPSPKALLVLYEKKEVHAMPKLVLDFYTNFEEKSKIRHKVTLGPGMKEMQAPEFRLFEIYGNIDTEFEVLDGTNHSLKVSLELCTGFTITN